MKFTFNIDDKILTDAYKIEIKLIKKRLDYIKKQRIKATKKEVKNEK